MKTPPTVSSQLVSEATANELSRGEAGDEWGGEGKAGVASEEDRLWLGVRPPGSSSSSDDDAQLRVQ